MSLGGVQLVRRDEHAGAVLGEPVDQRPERQALRRIERGVRLVEEEAARLPDQADGEAHALAPATGETVQALAGAVAEIGEVQGALGLGVHVDVAGREPGEEPEVLRDGQALVERGALRDPPECLGARRHGPGLRRLHARDHLEQRGLAGAVGPEIATRSPARTSRSTPSRILRPCSSRVIPRALSSKLACGDASAWDVGVDSVTAADPTAPPGTARRVSV